MARPNQDTCIKKSSTRKVHVIATLSICLLLSLWTIISSSSSNGSYSQHVFSNSSYTVTAAGADIVVPADAEGNNIKDMIAEESSTPERPATMEDAPVIQYVVLHEAKPSQLSKEIEKISHFASEAKIVIQLKGTNETRKCIHPRFVGRLSGLHLTTIEWERPSEDSNSHNQVIGHYHVPVRGRYYLEVISMLCNDFKFDTDFTNICIEDPEFHRITDDSAFIDVSAAGTHHHHRGYWGWSNQTKKEPSPLFTRYQAQNCRGGNSSQPRCIRPAAVDRFVPYQFVWNDPPQQLKDADINATKLCFVGASHAREIRIHVQKWLRRWEISSVLLQNVRVLFPKAVTSKVVQYTVNQNCSMIILGLAQHSAGHPGKTPTLFPAYKAEMTNLIKLFQPAGANLYLRSIHYNPLGDIATSCPPTDWRSPPVMDGYNDIIQNLCKKFDVPFINTKFIMDTMWDSAEDWSHYRGKAGAAEAAYILQHFLRSNNA